MSTDDWRERRKAATRRNIQDHALRLFLDKGYEETTVEEIAAAAGVSHMTFFRYFPRKEAVVESDEYDPLIADLIATRPADESPLQAIHQALRIGLAAVMPTDRQAILVRTRLILRTPALRARMWINEDTTRALFATALARRAGTPDPDYPITVHAAIAVAVVTTAVTAWAVGGGDGELVDFVDAAFAAAPAASSPADSTSAARSTSSNTRQ